MFRLQPRDRANVEDVEAAPAADAAAAAAALGQSAQPARSAGTLASVASGGYEEVELQPHSSSVFPPSVEDPATDAATTIAEAEEWGAAARAAEAADGAARRMRAAADKRAADAIAARRAGTMTWVEAMEEEHAARRMPVTEDAAEILRTHGTSMDEEATALGFTVPLSAGEARSVATLLATPKRTPGQKMVFVDRRTLGERAASEDSEAFGTPKEIPTTPVSNPAGTLLSFGESDTPGWGTGGLDELAEQVAEHVIREKASAVEDDGDKLGRRCQEALTHATHYANLEWGARAAAAAVEEEAAAQLAQVDQLVGQAEAAAAAVSALTAANLAMEDPAPKASSKKKGATPKRRGKWDTGAPPRRGRSAAKWR